MDNYIHMEESGDGGISYALYFSAVVITLVLFVFFLFNSNAYVAEEVLENGLHIAENKTLSVNQASGYDYNAPSGSRVDDFERDLDILHVITELSPGGGLTAGEQEQLTAVAEEFSNTLQEHLGLTGSSPTSGILLELCGPDASVLISSSDDKPISSSGYPGLVIYEPVFVRNVTQNVGVLGVSSFDITYDANEWIIYEVYYDTNNSVANVTKSTTNVCPVLFNGHPVEGATLEASVLLDVVGVKNIFNGVESDIDITEAGTWDETGTVKYNYSQRGPVLSPIFSDHPTHSIYNISVVQSADVVPAAQDSRKR